MDIQTIEFGELYKLALLVRNGITKAIDLLSDNDSEPFDESVCRIDSALVELRYVQDKIDTVSGELSWAVPANAKDGV